MAFHVVERLRGMDWANKNTHYQRIMKTKLAKPTIPHDEWTIESDIGQKSVDFSKLALHLEPEQEAGKYIRGNELRKRLEGKPVMSAAVLDYLIKHPEKTPESWKKNKDGKTNYIFFWGTIYRCSGGYLYVRCWYFFDGRWYSDYHWLDAVWSDQHPSAVAASTSGSETQPSSEPLDLGLRVTVLEEQVSALAQWAKSVSSFK